jgi:hypothetical protein
MTAPEPMAYISRCVCGGINFACVDKPDLAKETAKDIAGLIREGRAVERVSLDEARGKWCMTSKACRARAALPPPPEASP